MSSLADEDYCYVTTIGRVSGEPREIEIWFGLAGSTVYLLSGGRERSNWVRNMQREPRVSVRIGGESFEGRARVVLDEREDAYARELVAGKYEAGYSGDLSNWRRTALVVAIDLNPR
jgi:deazaflavin-dependent oxidoreductase (nitroreductase family)